MAKVTDFKFEIAGTKYVVHVNCNSSGQFNANLPEPVAIALDLKSKMSANTLGDLEKDFYAAIERYKTAETTEELYIFIKYRASGNYSKYKDGTYMFNGYGNKYELNTSFGAGHGLTFDFMVCIKETVDSVIKWYKTRKGSQHAHWDEEKRANPEKYYKENEMYNANEWKKIPFTETALQSLQFAEEKIRSASEILFNFIEMEEKEIALLLNNQKLLN